MYSHWPSSSKHHRSHRRRRSSSGDRKHSRSTKKRERSSSPAAKKRERSASPAAKKPKAPSSPKKRKASASPPKRKSTHEEKKPRPAAVVLSDDEEEAQEVSNKELRREEREARVSDEEKDGISLGDADTEDEDEAGVKPPPEPVAEDKIKDWDFVKEKYASEDGKSVVVPYQNYQWTIQFRSSKVASPYMLKDVLAHPGLYNQSYLLFGYTKVGEKRYYNGFWWNPNGSVQNIAGTAAEALEKARCLRVGDSYESMRTKARQAKNKGEKGEPLVLPQLYSRWLNAKERKDYRPPVVRLSKGDARDEDDEGEESSNKKKKPAKDDKDDKSKKPKKDSDDKPGKKEGDKPKDDKSKPKEDKGKAEKPKEDKGKAEKPKESKAEKPKEDKGKPKDDKTKAEKPKDDKGKKPMDAATFFNSPKKATANVTRKPPALRNMLDEEGQDFKPAPPQLNPLDAFVMRSDPRGLTKPASAKTTVDETATPTAAAAAAAPAPPTAAPMLQAVASAAPPQPGNVIAINTDQIRLLLISFIDVLESSKIATNADLIRHMSGELTVDSAPAANAAPAAVPEVAAPAAPVAAAPVDATPAVSAPEVPPVAAQ